MASKGLLMADHSKPTNSSLYTDYTTELDARFDDLAVGLDPAVTTATNIPTNTIRWNSANSYWEKYNGSTWAALDTGYEIDLAGARKILTNSASPALTITQTGSGNAFVVEDSASPDATPFVIDAAGKVIIGHTSPFPAIGGRVPFLNMFSNNSLTSSQLFALSSNDTIPSVIQFAKSRSGITGTITGSVVSNGDSIGSLSFYGDDGTTQVEAAKILATVDGTPGTNDMPGRLTFSTTADGASSPTERMRIDSEGRIGFGGTPTATAIVYINNQITGGTVSRLVRSNSIVQSDVTSEATVFLSNPATQAASFTLNSLFHFAVTQGTFGAGSSVTNQYGYIVNSNVIGATNNYGFYGNIPSGTGRWNFYAAGTAANYFAGDTWFGSAAGSTGLKLSSSSSGAQNTIAGNAAAGGQLDLEMFTADGTSGTSIRLFRSTNTTGDNAFTIFLGNGTNTANHVFNAKNSKLTQISSNNGSVELGNSAGYVESKASFSAPYVAHAAGTTAMAFGTYNVVRVTPNATATYTTTVPRAGAIVVLSILTSGTTSYTITFGTGFKSTGALATGTTSARYFNLTFVSDGTNLIETARTVAIA